MKTINPNAGMGSLCTHVGEGENPYDAHVMPIYQTSTFGFPDVATGAALFKGEKHGYIYTRMKNPNLDQLALKYAVLEGLDLLRKNPDIPPEKVVGGFVFSSGMAAITTAILARAKAGDTIIAQEALYGATYTFLHDIAPRFGLKVVLLKKHHSAGLEGCFQVEPRSNPGIRGNPEQPHHGYRGYCRSFGNCPSEQCLGICGQHVCHAVLPATANPGSRCRDAFDHQVPFGTRADRRRDGDQPLGGLCKWSVVLHVESTGR